MRRRSYRNLLWIAALLAGLPVAAAAQPPTAAGQAPNGVKARICQPQESGKVAAPAAPASEPLSVGEHLAGNNGLPAQTRDRIETASIIPDSASLLPVAALVGFSFLLGGIVCGAWKRE